MHIKRIFVCFEMKFPRSGANSNYIEYLSLALMSAGKEVIVLGKNKNNDINNYKEKVYKNIRYINNFVAGNKVSRLVKNNLFYGFSLVKLLQKYHANSNDCIIIYDANYFTNKRLLSYAKKNNILTCMCAVEWHQPFQFKKGIMDFRYVRWWLNFEFLIPRADKILPISMLLNDHFRSKNCDTFCLPILANPNEFEYCNRVKKDTAYHIIYSGSVMAKDDFTVMLGAFLLLAKEERKNIKFHITGIKEKTFTEYLGKKSDILNELSDILVIHPWLDYDDLVQLYYEMDFLLIARCINTVTKANFPSKVPEMMGFGIIPIVTRVGDYTKFYLEDNINSIIFDECTPESCFEAINRAIGLSDENVKIMRQNARICVETKFNYKHWASPLMNFLEE